MNVTCRPLAADQPFAASLSGVCWSRWRWWTIARFRSGDAIDGGRTRLYWAINSASSEERNTGTVGSLIDSRLSYWNRLEVRLVEAGGIEPPSEGLPSDMPTWASIFAKLVLPTPIGPSTTIYFVRSIGSIESTR